MLEYTSQGSVVWRSDPIPGASRVHAVGETILVNSFPELGSTRLLALDMDGNLLWTHDWDMHIHFEGIIAAEAGFLAYGWTDAGEELYPYAICLDESGGEVWRYEELERGEIVDAYCNGSETVLLAIPSRLIFLQNGFLTEIAEHPSITQDDRSVWQTALALTPWDGGYLIAVQLGHPFMDSCLVRQTDAQGNVLNEWRESFAGTVYSVDEAAFYIHDGTVYLAAYGKSPEAKILSIVSTASAAALE